jgi:hypothetical protein
VIKSRFALLALLLTAALSLGAGSAAAKPVLHWSQPQRIAPESPPSAFAEDTADISCADVSLCVAVGGEGKLLYSTDPTGGIEAWSESQLGGPGPADLTAVSCPAADFCAAVDAAGNVLVSDEPDQGVWTATAVGNGYPLTAIACASSTFCLAGDENGSVFVSEEPAGGAGAWEDTAIEVGEEVLSISCPSSTLCVVVTDEDVFTSTDPGAGSWSPSGLEYFRDVSCPSTTFCAATSFNGIFVSEEPAGGAGTWTESPGGTDSASWIECPTDAFCATSDIGGQVSTSEDPAGSDPEWEAFGLRAPSEIKGFSCPAEGFCAAILRTGVVLTSTDPAGGVHAWDLTATGGDASLRSTDCPTASLCLVAGPHGTLYTSTEPTVPGSWTGARITDGELEQVECKTVEWCFARADNRTLLYSTDPTGGAGAWNSVSMPFAVDAACPEFFFCAAVDGSGEVLLSSEPLAGAATWTALDLELPDWRLGQNQLREVSCPFWGLCAVGGDVGTVVTSSSPMGGKGAWYPSFVGNPDDFHNGAGPNIDGLDCPTLFFCAVTMWSGTIATTLDSPNPPVPWAFKSTEGSFFRAVSCSYEGGLCVAVSDLGWTISALDGTSGDPTWSAREPSVHEGLEEVSCAPADAFCLVVDDQGFATIGTVEDDGSTEPAVVVTPPSPVGIGNPPVHRRCKAKRSKGKRAGGLAIGGAIPLSKAPKAGQKGRQTCGSR